MKVRRHMLTRWLVAIMLGIPLASVTAVPRAESVPINTLPPDVQQLLRAVWVRVPAEGKRQTIVAIQALSPDQAERAVANIRSWRGSVPLNQFIESALALDSVRASLPPAYQQAFVNGVWGVTAAEEQFATHVLQGAAAQAQPPRFGGFASERDRWRDWRWEQDNYLCSWNKSYSFCRSRGW